MSAWATMRSGTRRTSSPPGTAFRSPNWSASSQRPRPAAHHAEVLAELRATVDAHEAVRRPLLVDEHRRARVAAQRPAAHDAGAGDEDDVVAVEEEPDRQHVGAAVPAGHRQLAGAGAVEQEGPPLLDAHITHAPPSRVRVRLRELRGITRMAAHPPAV